MLPLRAMRRAAAATAAHLPEARGIRMVRALSTAPPTTPPASKSSPLSQYGGVHGTRVAQKTWRNKPLFRREGDARFRTGAEAAQMLLSEAKRRDGHEVEFIQAFENAMTVLAPVFERIPKYAFVAKEWLEPERVISFKLTWIDDAGTVRLNRGYRVQYSSALGPYEGGLHFSKSVNVSLLKAMAFSRTFTNALSGCEVGAAVGGADFDPSNKSEAEIQRFCQAYMTELSKYIGPNYDYPSIGVGVGPKEIGYLYGQNRRIKPTLAQKGKSILWGGAYPFPQAAALGVVGLAKKMLEKKGESLEGKRCLVTGSGKMALHVAERLLELGAVPVTLSDTSGHIYEPDGIDAAKLKIIQKIKSERGARIGRYIIASTTAKFNEPESVWAVPHDLAFPCATHNEIDAATASLLADNGTQGVFEGAFMPSTNDAVAVYKKRGLLFGSHVASMAADSLVNGLELSRNPIGAEQLEERINELVDAVYAESKATAKEFNIRADMHAGATIAGFLRVADSLVAHGAV